MGNSDRKLRAIEPGNAKWEQGYRFHEVAMNAESTLTVVGIGEALFDRFSEDRFVLGGAPANFAVHAHQLLVGRGEGVITSRVGEDDLGKRFINEIAKRGMRTDCVEVTSDFPTGTVDVELDSGSPTYQINENVAWDHLEFSDAWGELAPQASAVCFGTLAQRSPESREAILQFLTNAPNSLKICDINLRQHYYTADIIRSSLVAADVVKLNEEELITVGKALDEEVLEASIDERIARLIREFNLRLLALTRGKDGTVLYTDREKVTGEPTECPKVAHADDVGAGDACCAAIAVSMLLGKPLQEIANLANRVGAYVASQPGATPVLPTGILI
jgi:fructokinase